VTIAFKSTNVIAYATWHARPTLIVTATAGWLGRPILLTSAGAFDRDEPDAMRQYPRDAAASLVEQPSFLHADAAVAYDSRDHASYPTSGGMYRGSAGTYRDRMSQVFSFERFEVEAARFVPVAGDRGGLAFHW